ncbi:hypothetical protein NDU88_003059 [Pleurodeles waltl]|uniref:Uncharacterized protein n=1 Tax=Pleurodeles waltl TaxID=8319 RepID=A0AAV7V187_PLEWA|nr:hypothetical protein NDU88_003059 [Pleurodeles waltl]
MCVLPHRGRGSVYQAQIKWSGAPESNQSRDLAATHRLWGTPTPRLVVVQVALFLWCGQRLIDSKRGHSARKTATCVPLHGV